MSNDPLEAVFVTGDEAAALKRADTARKLAAYLERMPVELRGMFAEEFQHIKRDELSQLRIELAAAQERIAQQAAQLEQAREFAEYVCDNETSKEFSYQRAKSWLTENAQPQPQEQSA